MYYMYKYIDMYEHVCVYMCMNIYITTTLEAIIIFI